MKTLRIIVALTGLLGAIFLPWWVPILCILLLSLRFRAWEAVFIGGLLDLLWRSPGFGIEIIPFFTIGSIIVVWGLEPLRKEFLTV